MMAELFAENRSVCDLYMGFAEAAVKEWDGQKTSDLLLLICKKTGEEPIRVLTGAIISYVDQQRA